MPNRDRITVQGTARRRVSPDIAVWTAVVDSRATTQGAAFAACSSSLAALLKDVKAAAGNDCEIWASGVYVSGEWDDRGQRRAGFAGSGSVSIRARLDEAARLGQVALDAGATRLDGPVFEVSNADDVMDELRGEAVIAARETAERMAIAAGRALGTAIIISDGAADGGGGPRAEVRTLREDVRRRSADGAGSTRDQRVSNRHLRADRRTPASPQPFDDGETDEPQRDLRLNERYAAMGT